MKKVLLLIVLFVSITTAKAQKGQKIGYIDMEYILENVPEYLTAQNTLDAKVKKWKSKLDKEVRHIEVLKTDLANEKAILTKDLIAEKEDEITLKQEELRRLESLFFGPKGDMYLVRKQLVKPVQDRVYNAIQSITKRLKYDFVFDKSSDLVMLYSNKKYDISALVLKSINREVKKDEIQAKKDAKNASKKEATDAAAVGGGFDEGIDERKQATIDKKEAQRKAALAKKAEQKKALEAKKEAAKKRKEEKRKLLKAKIEERKKKKEQLKKDREAKAAQKKLELEQKKNNNN